MSARMLEIYIQEMMVETVLVSLPVEQRDLLAMSARLSAESLAVAAKALAQALYLGCGEG